MTKTLQAIAITLSAVATFGTVFGANGLASKQFASAQRIAAAQVAAVQHVDVIAHLPTQRVVVVGRRNA
jgi:hypothetical protein